MQKYTTVMRLKHVSTTKFVVGIKFGNDCLVVLGHKMGVL